MVKEKHCPNCQNKFHCSSQCWCSAFPPIFPLEDGKGCLCPSCLKAEAINSINNYTASLDGQKVKTIQKLGLPEQLIEGIDYTINEQGFYVFTAWYLLRQGKCCGNGCKNCPYDKINKS
ncbi:hypothetical protein KZP23_19510 [Echinicola marina]|uniref:DUF5522 domain-containing protein n=1 Tax=Echinicola marina TaxID=2859768 RepID=UPI001CF62335|nr:DUF5522 domain-containing protein [Echinicola marina]UCS92834.1 hypothetical protein KZP23_19510 [Echinicola marina]